ncbi:MlaD family protein [Sphingosinicella sp. BN140058]|uniref:MlaD family protein n=1 Tax=Sphingosinicella sp. BN140058 TaxID=1892855 RepID=UPI0010129A73|nr:MlaD family protein [Sphingosinicella sp. BN140058]QAY79583.1 MCE family protein [Sphingosinicella sp. BN140058]
METRSHILLVSLVVLGVFSALVAFVMWITPDDPRKGRQYDILFDQSVSGLVEGSSVTFAGIPVGRVQSIGLEPGKPDLVRVRIAITDKELPIIEGTRAALNGDLVFGSALISLDAPRGSGQPIRLNTEGVGLIPAKNAGLGELVSDPGPMVERISRGTDMLLELTSPQGQREISARLDATVKSTSVLAQQSATIDRQIAASRATLKDTTRMAADYAKRADAIEQKLDRQGSATLRQLRQSSADARATLRSLDQRLDATRPSVQSLSTRSADLGTKVRDLRSTVANVRTGIEQVEEGGLGSLAAPPALPDYKPKD